MPKVAQSTKPIYQNAEASIDERVEDLLSRMTIEEKVGQMTQLDITLINKTGKQKDVELVDKKARYYLKEHHIGSFLNGEAVPATAWYTYIYNLQKIAVEETRLGIPIIYGIDHMHGASYVDGSTIFPHNVNLGATFNADHAKENGNITVLESADLGHHWIFAPVLDIGRDPRWARLYETFGESTHVAATMGEAFVKAVQDHKEVAPYKVAATGKHFLGYSAPSSGWDRTPVDLSDQTIFEIYVPSFQKAIDAGLKAIMLNSSEISGIPVHASKKIVTDLLRKKMGFKGLILTDWDDLGKLVDYHHTAKDYTQATEMAINAGIDMNMTPNSLDFNESLLKLVKDGRVKESRLDESVRRILKLKFELGLFEHPFPRNDRFQRIGASENRAKAKAAADESIILLKNKYNTLPISADTKDILLIGPNANSKSALGGGWTLGWQGAEPERYPKDMHTIYTALKDRFPDSDITLLPTTVSDSRVVKEAKKHDLILVAIGEEPYTEFIGNITTLELPADQKSLIKAAASANKPLVGIFVGGRPLIVEDVIEDMSSYLWTGLPGFEGAEAIADILAGNVNPSAKLPLSYPLFASHFVPYNHKSSSVYKFDPEQANFIMQEEHSVWQWPFGHGLSYTSFEYSKIRLSKTVLSKNDKIEATVTIKNSGSRAGKEAVIWYLKDHVGSITRPVKEVKHFEKISLEPGQSKEVSFTIEPAKHLGFPDFDGTYILESGMYTLNIGGKLAEFELLDD
jgi:beta-glucosidase